MSEHFCLSAYTVPVIFFFKKSTHAFAFGKAPYLRILSYHQARPLVYTKQSSLTFMPTTRIEVLIQDTCI
jgi:hypothetical protein